MNPFTAKWPPWIAGPLLALLIVAALALFDDSVGLSGGMTALTEYADSTVARGRLAAAPSMDWQIAMLFGLFFGAIAGALSSGEFKLEFLDEGGSAGERICRTVLAGSCGGFLLMLGVQLAGETVWGQWAAAIQLAGGGWTFLAGMLLAGCLLAILFERRGEGGGSGRKTAGGKGGRR